MNDNATYFIRNPPTALVFCNEAFHHDPTSEGLPGQPNDFTRKAQIVECPNSGFGVWSRKRALKTNFAVIWPQSLDNSPTSG